MIHKLTELKQQTKEQMIFEKLSEDYHKNGISALCEFAENNQMSKSDRLHYLYLAIFKWEIRGKKLNSLNITERTELDLVMYKLEETVHDGVPDDD